MADEISRGLLIGSLCPNICLFGPGNGIIAPDSKVHEANMGPIWGRQDPGGPYVGHMNFAIRDSKIKDTWWWGRQAMFTWIYLFFSSSMYANIVSLKHGVNMADKYSKWLRLFTDYD